MIEGIELGETLPGGLQEGVQTATGQEVLVQFVNPSDLAWIDQRLQQLNSIDDPRLLLPIDVHLDGKNPYLVFPHFPMSWEALEKAGQARPSEQQVGNWVHNVLGVLELTHQNGFLHGHLSARNLWLDRNSEVRVGGWFIPPIGGASRKGDFADLGRTALKVLTGGIPPKDASELVEALGRASRGSFSRAEQFRAAMEPRPEKANPNHALGAAAALLVLGLALDLRLLFLALMGATAGAMLRGLFAVNEKAASVFFAIGAILLVVLR